MSLRAILSVFDNSQSELATRLVLLALADHAHDDGSNAYPAVPTIARKARVRERTVQRSLRWAERACEIVPVGRTSRGVTIYHMTLVQPLSFRVPLLPGGDNLTPEVLTLEERFNDGSGGEMSPPGRQDDTTPAATRRPDPEPTPPGFVRAIGWLMVTGKPNGFDEQAALDVLTGHMGIPLESANLALSHVYGGGKK